jgi:mono/diheme cytochrome c family protein
MASTRARSFILIGSLVTAVMLLVSCGQADDSDVPPLTRVPAQGAPTEAPPAGESAATSPTGGATVPPETAAGTGDQTALVTRGEQLFNQFACASCHSVSGQRLAGPALNGLAGQPVQLVDGQTVTADDAYLRESILQPDARIVAGYSPGVMSSGVAAYEDQLAQGDTVEALVAYIKSLQR